MKKFKFLFYTLLAFIGLFLIHPTTALSSEIKPTSDFYFYDDVGILTKEDKEEIISKNKKYEKTEEKPQIVVIVTKKNIDVDSEAPKIFERFKIGNKKLDNGLLILYSKPEKRIRIEVGYGLEGAIPDATAGDILDYNLDKLKSNNKTNISKGLMKVFRATSSLIDNEYKFSFSNYEKPDYISDDSEELSFPIVAIIIIVIIAWVILLIINPELALDILFIILNSMASSSSSSSRGGGGRSGGGGASR